MLTSKKSGVVILLGRTNSGKSTLLNNLLRMKVSITSPKPQTTRFPIRAVLNEERGQIIFVDTPGIFAKAEDTLSEKINQKAFEALEETADVALYIVDHTRHRGIEENRVLGTVRKLKAQKILLINKIDVIKPSFMEEYEFLKEEFENCLEISALKGWNLDELKTLLFELLPQREPILSSEETKVPILNLDSRQFLAELIREKIFLLTRQEIPYTTTVEVDQLEERDEMLVITARILTTDNRYKKMLIGKKGVMIKNIGTLARKEMALISNKKVYLDLTVETDKHWMERFP